MQLTKSGLWRLAVLAALSGVASCFITASPASATPISCLRWDKTTIASGFGPLENLGFDNRGNVLLSQTAFVGPGRLLRLSSLGKRSVAVASVDGPGGIVVAGGIAFFNTGNTSQAGFGGTANGTLRALNLNTGISRIVSTGLTAPNGLARIAENDFVVSRSIGSTSGLTRITNGTARPLAPSVHSPNGVSFDADSGTLWASTMLTPRTTVTAVNLRHPQRAPQVIPIPGNPLINLGDDLTIGRDGTLFLALNTRGTVLQINPHSGSTCAIADGIPFVSSVRFGSGHGWDSASLYATSFTGTVTKLSPPPR